MTPRQATDAAWEAEAVVWQPNVLLESLGLATEHPVLEQETYVVQLDHELNVVSYGMKEGE